MFKAMDTSQGIILSLVKKKNQPLDGMVILTPNGPIENVAIEMSNILMEGEHVPTFQIEGI